MARRARSRDEPGEPKIISRFGWNAEMIQALVLSRFRGGKVMQLSLKAR
jgi:hypothetical protein